jgi:G6PDH family F420-dependent oxidoreductase
VVIAAGGAEAARLAGRKGDGLIVTERRPDLIEEFEAAGGSGPRYAEVALCYAEREQDAQQTAHHYFRWSVTGWPVLCELPDTEGFAAASKHVPPEVVAKSVSCGPSPERHLEAINRFVRAGYDHIILLQVGPDQDAFFDLFERELATALRERGPA